MLRDHPDLVNYTRAWTLSEPLISMYNITGLVLKAVPSSRARILHFIGCQEFLDHLMFFRFIPVMNSQVTFLTLQNVTLDTTEFFRLLVATPNLEFLVVSHDQFFVSEVAEKVYAVKKGQLVHLEGGMEEYVKSCRKRRLK